MLFVMALRQLELAVYEHVQFAWPAEQSARQLESDELKPKAFAALNETVQAPVTVPVV